MQGNHRIIAVRHIDFTNNDGERIFGDQIYLEGDAEPGTGWFNGVCCEKVWVDGLNPRCELGEYKPTPGDYVACTYNRYGKINSIKPAF